MTDLAEFLAARLDEDERELVKDPPMGLGYANLAARLRRDIEAKRKILAEVVPQIEDMDQQIISEWGNSQTVPDAHLPLLKIMAAVYCDHPGYCEEWKLAP